jgi:DNA-binding LacI/PurR family transcriptional regulator
MMQQRKIPIYSKIAFELQGKIRDGFFPENGRLPSRAELCRKYNISDMTAVKVHNELEKNGIAYKIKGKGVFAVSPQHFPEKMLKPVKPATQNIIVYNWANKSTGSYPYILKIMNGIQQKAIEYGMNLRNEIFTPENQGSYDIHEQDALIVPYESGCEWMLPMLKHKRMRCVLINNYFPEAHCVIFDNYHGIMLLLDHLESRGCRKIFMCTRHFVDLGMANLNERSYAFENECSRRGLKYRLLTDGNYNKLIKLLETEKPDAVMFTNDEVALKFKEMLKTLNLPKQPLVSGFDGMNMAKGEETKGIITVKVDYVKIGQRAVELIKNNSLEDWGLPDVIRVRGKLIIDD